MLKINKNYDSDRKILKCYYIRCSPAETSTINTPESQICIKIHGEYSNNSLLNSYLQLSSEVIKKIESSGNANGNDIRLVNLGPIALFSQIKLTASSRKHLEDTSHAHIDTFMYKLLTSSRGSDDLSNGFDRDRNRGRDELTGIKNIEANSTSGICAKTSLVLQIIRKKLLLALVIN